MTTSPDTSVAALAALAHRLQRLQHLSAHLIQNGRRGLKIGQTQSYWTQQTAFAKLSFLIDENLKNPKWPPGAPKWPTGSLLRFLGALINFCKISFLIRALLL